ncbi:hypothetical protein Lal_00036730 [Lupinus albus]|uniref:Putative isoflavone-7-O-beta-glucoside 6''-O-malonyltransferase n=1 Tax=Lupinus albus TaxID=3870 RepID=A0A6A4PUV2_LUPAL|nr:putative isoflavone-7-O-beta-glucoside 6''-O-malonyltransferase [Lupinus albus]KAF1888689.1 hypothetical protein Lal_00036730 [Lupinus albus]
MVSNKNSIKIHDHFNVTHPSSETHLSIPLTFFDLFWLRFHPVERIYFYSFPSQHTDPSFFYNQIVPKLKTSLSLTLQHFLPLAGKIVWPSDSEKPIIQYNPGDVGVSLVIAESDANFNHILDNSLPHEASESRSFVPHLESSDSSASAISIQITLFPNSGFCIGISAHHAVLDGKSSTLFIKAWASLCQKSEESSSLVQELEPLFDREVIKDPKGLDTFFTNHWKTISSMLNPSDTNNNKTLTILSTAFPPKVEDSLRATFELTRSDLDKIKKKVLSKWDTTIVDEVESNNSTHYPKPHALSTFVATCAYVTVCIAKAFEESEKKKQKVWFGFTVDCRTRLEPQVPDNYFGNCVCGHVTDAKSEDFTKEDGLVIVAKKIYSKIKKIDKGVLDGIENLFSTYKSLMGKNVIGIGVAGSNRFSVYGTNFGWGNPTKVEITSVDRGITIGMTESKNEKGGVEVGLVLNKNVMGFFHILFHAGLSQN